MTAATATPRKRVRTFQALHHRNFRLFWFGLIVSNAGSWMQTVAQGWLVLKLTNNAADIGLIGLVRAIPLILFSLFGGAFADLVDRRKLLYVTQTVQGLLAAALGVLIYTGRIQIWHIYLVSFLTALALAFDQPTRQSLVPSLVPREDLMNAVSLNSVAFQGAAFFGPTLTGLLAPIIGLGGIFVINGISFAAVLIALMMMDIPSGAVARRSQSMMADLVRGIHEVRKDKRIMALVFVAAVSSLFGRGYNSYLPVVAERVLHVGIQGLGYLMSGPGLGTIIASLTVASLGNYHHKGKIVMFSGLGFALALIAYSWSSSFTITWIMLAVVGGLNMVLMATINTTVQLLTRDEVRGRVVSIFTVMNLAGMPLGQAPLGALMQKVGPSLSITSFASLVLLGGLLIAVLLPQIWQVD